MKIFPLILATRSGRSLIGSRRMRTFSSSSLILIFRAEPGCSSSVTDQVLPLTVRRRVCLESFHKQGLPRCWFFLEGASPACKAAFWLRFACRREGIVCCQIEHRDFFR